MPQITLIQYPGLTRDSTMSAPCGKVRMALSFKGIEYRVLTDPPQVTFTMIITHRNGSGT